MIPTYYIKCPKLNLVYVQVPKAANSSIISSLNNTELWFDRRQNDHQLVQDYIRHYKKPYSDKTTEDCEFFTWFSFVRNPYDRIISSFVNKVIQPEDVFHSFSILGINKKTSFLDFCKKIQKENPKNLNDHIKPQHLILKMPLDFVGKVESIDKDWQLLRKIKPLLHDITHLNKSSKYKNEDFLCSESIKIINEIYKKDFTDFSYKTIL